VKQGPCSVREGTRRPPRLLRFALRFLPHETNTSTLVSSLRRTWPAKQYLTLKPMGYLTVVSRPSQFTTLTCTTDDAAKDFHQTVGAETTTAGQAQGHAPSPWCSTPIKQHA
jgi:hypothetical protein